MNLQRLFPALLCLSILFSCKKDDEPVVVTPETEITSEFESGNGIAQKISDTEWEITIPDDNGNPNLPDSWRSWWYIALSNADITKETKLTIKNSGWMYYYVPVYSYDQKNWFRFDVSEVNQDGNEIIVTSKFEKPAVWVAMFYPYTLTDLENYLSVIENNPNVKVEVAGKSQNNNPLYLIKVSDFSQPVANKKRILIHARTHPAETPSSFVIEGLINFLISGNLHSAEMLRDYEFHIFPMQNVDGVIAGNYRSTPKSENLEVMWYYDINNPLNLSIDTPPEIAVIHAHALQLMNEGPPVSIALNLHASNSEPDIRPFFYPHFGPQDLGYSPQEAALWDSQLRFISSVAFQYGYPMIEPVPLQGGSSFAGKQYPESWWWVNYKDQVMAMTMEMTYGRAGYAPNWVIPEYLRILGSATAQGIRDYFTLPAQSPYLTSNYKSIPLKYPELYPPNAADENKE